MNSREDSLTRRENVEKLICNPEDDNLFLEVVNEFYSSKPLMSKKAINKQLELIGLDIKNVAETAFGLNDNNEPDIAQYNKSIIDLYNRRNEIAHQSDRSHKNNIKNDIGESTVVEYIKNISKIVNATYRLAQTKNQSE